MDLIAVPLSSGVFCPHFGGAEQFLLFRADPENATIHGTEAFSAPPHKPGALPRWLSEHGVTAVLAGQMGDRARTMLSRLQIEVVGGVSGIDPDRMIKAYLDGSLSSGDGHCDGTGHGHAHQCGGGHGHGKGLGHQNE
jgi:ATP-binding protein involved in chromosome partitioning